MKSSISQITSQWDEYACAMKKHLTAHKATPPPINEASSLQSLSQLITLLQNSQEKAIIITDNISDAVTLEMTLELIDHSLNFQLILPHSKQTINADNRLIITAIPSLIIGNENELKIWQDYSIILYNPQSNNTVDHSLVVKRFFSDQIEKCNIIPFNHQNILETREQTNLDLMPNENTPQKTEAVKESKEAPKKKESLTKEVISLHKNETEKIVLKEINITLLQGNFKRQYIRDQVRNQRLKDVVVVTDNHQEARQLQNYLYRGRIRTKTIHNRTPEKIEQQIIDEFNNNRLTVLVILDEKLSVIQDKLTNVEISFLYDLPNVYVELTDLLRKTSNYYEPKNLIALATENQRAWVEDLQAECPKQKVIINEVEANHRQRQNNQQERTPKKEQTPRNQTAPRNNTSRQQTTNPSENRQRNDQADNNHQRNHDQTEKRQTNTNQPRRNQNPNQTRSNQARPNQQRNRPHNQQRNRTQNQRNQSNDNLGNVADGQQGNIVNKNRLPFEANSFEANIAKINKRRGRPAFSGDPNRNFAQELQDQHQQRGNQRSSRNRRNNNNNVDGNR